jgi:nucleoid DNA-binding protein
LNTAELVRLIAKDHEISAAKAGEIIADVLAKIKPT